MESLNDERVDRLEVRAELLEAVSVQELAEPLAEAQAEVVVALRAHAEVALEPLVVDERRAGGAAEPLGGHGAAGGGEISQLDHPR